MASSASTPLERAIAVAVFAPIGFGAQLADDFPGTDQGAPANCLRAVYRKDGR